MLHHFRLLKGHRKIAALTCYDYSMARLFNELALDFVLVGDSLGMVMLGYQSTHLVSFEDMLRFAAAVRRGYQGLVVFDMPMGTCDAVQSALDNCRKAMDETGVSAVKIEGKPDIVAAVCESGIPVMGHTGLKPQEVSEYKVQGRDAQHAQLVFDEAIALEKAGVFCLILECVPRTLAAQITQKISVPTVGIGAGPDCDGQILVTHDMLGLYSDFTPKFVRHFAEIGLDVKNAVSSYIVSVKEGTFPREGEWYEG